LLLYCVFSYDALKTHYGEGVDFPNLKKEVIKHVLKHKVRIAAQNIKDMFSSKG